MSRNIDFYQDVLKFEVINRYEVEGQLIWALLKASEVEFIVLGAEPSGSDDRDTLIYFCAENRSIIQRAIQTAGYSLALFQEALYEPGYDLMPSPQPQAAA